MVSLEKYYDPQRKLRLVGLLDHMGQVCRERGKLLIVKSVNEDSVLMRLLQEELFPSISFTLNVGHISFNSYQ